ncbi:hypothetical protein [Pontibacter toksunensis]
MILVFDVGNILGEVFFRSVLPVAASQIAVFEVVTDLKGGVECWH